MNELIWIGNTLLPRVTVILLAVVAVVGCAIAFILVCGLINWLVNPTAKPGKQ